MVEPVIAKLGHVSSVTPDLEKSLWFFRDAIGLEVTERSASTRVLAGGSSAARSESGRAIAC